MAVAVHISCEHMSKQDYERVIKDLEKSGHGEPEGRLVHVAFDQGHVGMFEVWKSREHFDAHRERLFETLQDCGISSGIVNVHPVISDHPD